MYNFSYNCGVQEAMRTYHIRRWDQDYRSEGTAKMTPIGIEREE